MLRCGVVAQGCAYVFVVVIPTLQPNEAREPGEFDVSCKSSLGNAFSGCIVCIGYGVVVLPTENSVIRASGYTGEKLPTVVFTFLRYDPEPTAEHGSGKLGIAGMSTFPIGSINPHRCWLIRRKRR